MSLEAAKTIFSPTALRSDITRSKPRSASRELCDYGTRTRYTLLYRLGPGPDDHLRYGLIVPDGWTRQDVARALRSYRQKAKELSS